jgi:hypothetical protein
VTGNISLGTKPDNGSTAPRDALVSFRLWSNKPGPTSYKLTCSGRHEWTGTLPTVRVAPGKFGGHGIQVVSITTTTKLACALRSTSIPGAPLAAIASKDYVVVYRNPVMDGPKGVVAKSQGTHGAQWQAEGTSVLTAPSPRHALRKDARDARE